MSIPSEVRAWRQWSEDSPTCPHISFHHKTPEKSHGLLQMHPWPVVPLRSTGLCLQLLHLKPICFSKVFVSMSQINPSNTFFRLFLIEDTSFFPSKKEMPQISFYFLIPQPLLAAASSEPVALPSVNVRGQPHSWVSYGSQPSVQIPLSALLTCWIIHYRELGVK